METNMIDSICFEFRRKCLSDPWVLFAKYHGAVYVCLTPFESQIDAKEHIAEVFEGYVGLDYLESDWEMIWSDSPNFIDGQMRMSQEKLTDESYDPLPM